MFEIINGKKEENLKKKKEIKDFKIKKYKQLYNKYKNNDLKKTIFYGIKYLSHFYPKDESYEELLEAFKEFDYIKVLVSLISYKDFLQLFPIEKTFDGEKFQCKDYFSTIDYLKDKDMESEIKYEEDVDLLFWNYYNTEVMNFGVMQTIVCDRLIRMEGKKGFLESFIDEIDKEGKITTYTYHEKEGYMYDNKTGKTFKVQKPKPRKPKYLNEVKTD